MLQKKKGAAILRKSKIVNEKSYGVVINQKNGIRQMYEFFDCAPVLIKTSVGELLLSLIESADFLNKLISERPNDDCLKIISKYFSEQEYDLSPVFISFNFNIIELKRLIRLRDYLEFCIDNPEMCSNVYLQGIAYSVLPKDSEILNIFGRKNRYKIRQVISKNPILFGQTTKEIERDLTTKLAEYSFSTKTSINTLSELCVLSLFEIYESGQIVRRCEFCKKLFISRYESVFCHRPSEKNDFRGCQEFKSFIINQNKIKNLIKREYKSVYSKLYHRAKNNSTNSLNTFLEFKNGWLKLNKSAKSLSSYERRNLQHEYLTSERWK